MHPTHRLVNQQLAFAKTQLQLSLAHEGFLQRCHHQAAWLQLAAALQAYANELLHRLNLPPAFSHALNAPPYFSPAWQLAAQAKANGQALAECAELEQHPSWLHSAVHQIQQGLAPAPQNTLSPLLQHTSLQQSLIASSRNNPQNNPLDVSLSQCLSAFEALIQRQRTDTHEY